MPAYYNEVDHDKAAWLRELIKANVIAPGEVDERPIQDVRADDLRGFRQCHFFAGIGVWSYALRLADWPDDGECWTGSCPCPSFSCAGKGTGFDDPRHLWPEWYRLIRECRPGVLFGEQADGAIGHGWLDLVCGDLEAEGYAVAPAVLGAHSAGAPHRRQRLYFVGERADTADCDRRSRVSRTEAEIRADGIWRRGFTGAGNAGRSPDATDARRNDAREYGSRRALLPARLEQHGGADSGADTQRDGGRADLAGREAQGRDADGRDCETGDDAGGEYFCFDCLGRYESAEHDCPAGDSSHADGRELSDGDLQRSGEQRLLAEDCETGDLRDTTSQGLPQRERDGRIQREAMEPQSREAALGRGDFIRDYANRIGATRGFWGDCDWWWGRDGKYRPIEPGIQPLAHGATARVLKLRGYGDAIVAPVAQAFIKSYLAVRNL